MINKLDRATSRPQETESKIFDLYCSLDAPEEYIDYPLLYGSGKDGWADENINNP